MRGILGLWGRVRARERERAGILDLWSEWDRDIVNERDTVDREIKRYNVFGKNEKQKKKQREYLGRGRELEGI